MNINGVEMGETLSTLIMAAAIIPWFVGVMTILGAVLKAIAGALKALIAR